MIGIVTLLKVMIRNLVFTLHGIRIMLLEVTKVMMFYQYLLDQVVKKHVARTNGMGFARDKMVITSVNKT